MQSFLVEHKTVKRIKPVMLAHNSVICKGNGEFCLFSSMVDFHDKHTVIDFKSCPNLLNRFRLDCKGLLVKTFVGKQPFIINGNISQFPFFKILASLINHTLDKIVFLLNL